MGRDLRQTGRPGVTLKPTAPPPMHASGWRSIALLASAHRPLFLLTAMYAVLAMAVWLAVLGGVLPGDGLAIGAQWHGHEMIFGFAAAGLAGFSMAAVPNWTGTPLFRGGVVVLVVALWLAGRVGALLPGLGWLDLLFLPTVAGLTLARIVRARNHRNLQVPAMFLALAGLDAWHHLDPDAHALRPAVHVVVAVVALVAGRIVPAFTRNALRQRGMTVDCTTPKWLDRLAVPAVLAVAVAEIAAPQSVAGAGLAAFAAVVLLARMARWHSLESRSQPILWILHLGYLWLPLGLALEAAAVFCAWPSPTAALHALTAGAIGTMILAVATRAALGHSGRPLKVSPPIIVAYVLVLAAAAVRVFVPGTFAIFTAGTLWCLSFAVFFAVYFPILTRPRVDGKPG